MSKLRWLPEHAEQLKRLRLAAGVEITTLAKKHSLSSSQVHQLEESGDSAFYSPEIKRSGSAYLNRFTPRDKDTAGGLN